MRLLPPFAVIKTIRVAVAIAAAAAAGGAASAAAQKATLENAAKLPAAPSRRPLNDFLCNLAMNFYYVHLASRVSCCSRIKLFACAA